MRDLPTDRRPPSELLASIRAAHGYVRASDDLRPRVLEAARSICIGRRLAGRMTSLAASLLLATALLNLSMQHFARQNRDLHVEPNQLLEDAQSSAVSGAVDPGFGLVEAFLHLRWRQSEAITGAVSAKNAE
ncbi:hypothetical protein Pla175_25650 [Pirellulimonas nuda]|uniref:Uncharacterized protein n=1 Tax=Pirellulimonas nuda TaxID=2528009 RepID=A0A518DCH2_9BACT|nr:hypothetical protein [Pirellulimonas nuda]QDU89178.1 hypothetical protein Pla175_25650 [Pirellulimonas nuda]